MCGPCCASWKIRGHIIAPATPAERYLALIRRAVSNYLYLGGDKAHNAYASADLYDGKAGDGAYRRLPARTACLTMRSST